VASARTFMKAAPEDVFNVLSDANGYVRWVVGCQQVLQSDVAWPNPGSSFEHRVGFGPLAVQDITTVVESSRPRRLVLRARAWPLGESIIDFRIRTKRDGSEVEMRQTPAAGPIAALDNPFQDFVTSLRDRETLRRLRQLAEAVP
jgi:polyketide cyclase/dehydrase/lipid transport protein